MTTNGKGRGNGEAMDAQKQKAVALAVSAIEKQFGKGAILMMSDEAIDREVKSFSSGSVSLDLALGIGGYPRGRVVEIFGPEALEYGHVAESHFRLAMTAGVAVGTTEINLNLVANRFLGLPRE